MIINNLEEMMETVAQRLTKLNLHPSVIEPLEDEVLFCCTGFINAVMEDGRVAPPARIHFSLDMKNDRGEDVEELWLHAEFRGWSKIPNGHYLVSHLRKKAIWDHRNFTLLSTFCKREGRGRSPFDVIAFHGRELINVDTWNDEERSAAKVYYIPTERLLTEGADATL